MLNAQQQTAVDIGINHRAVCINAGPGSGKTTSMILRVRRLLEEGVSPNRIAVVTLTIEAAENMWAKLVKEMPELRNSGLQSRVCTIHALSFRIWKKHTGVSPNVLVDEGDTRFVRENELKEIIASVGFGKWFSNVSPNGLMDWIDRTKQEGLIGDNARAYCLMHLGPSDGGAVYESIVMFNRWCAAKGYTTFADMLLNVDMLMRQEKDRKSWSNKYIVVDEAQDTSAQAMRILSALAEGGQLWMVGDVAQALFEFAGANPEENLGSKFEARYPEGQRCPLQINYRSTVKIIDVANQVVENSFED